jgi:hypothetical protein
MEETSFSGAELAGRARVAPELVGRLVELGILRPGDGEAPFGLGDVRRVRLADACERAGLSLAFLDLVSIAGRPLTETTYEQLCAEQGLPVALVQRIHEPRGWGGPSPVTRSTRSTGTCWAAPRSAGCWAWRTGC